MHRSSPEIKRMLRSEGNTLQEKERVHRFEAVQEEGEGDVEREGDGIVSESNQEGPPGSASEFGAHLQAWRGGQMFIKTM